jgi:hypothetical protein
MRRDHLAPAEEHDFGGTSAYFQDYRVGAAELGSIVLQREADRQVHEPILFYAFDHVYPETGLQEHPVDEHVPVPGFPKGAGGYDVDIPVGDAPAG